MKLVCFVPWAGSAASAPCCCSAGSARRRGAGVNLELQVIAAVIIGGVALFGGRGTIFGSFIGVLILSMLTSGIILMGVKQFWDGVATAAVILVAAGLDLLVRQGPGRLMRADE